MHLSTPTPSPVEHCYFLDKATAEAHYQMAQEVVYAQGHRLRQFCYYLGSEDEPMVDVNTPYLVNLPSSKIIEFFQNYLAYPIPTKVEAGPATQQAEAKEMIQTILDIFSEIQSDRKERVDDALFTQPVMAEWMAIQQIQTYRQHPHIAAIQLCYVIGTPEAGKTYPQNLIFLPEEAMAETLYQKTARTPKILVMSPFDSPELKVQGQKFLTFIQQSFQKWVQHQIYLVLQKIQQLSLDPPRLEKLKKTFQGDREVRVLIFASYYTTVMRYALENMAKAFEKIGCEVRFIMDSPYRLLLDLEVTQTYLSFKPHLVFNINHLNNQTLSNETFNCIWWQDLMPPLQNSESFAKVRLRDFHFAFSEHIYESVKAKGVPVRYQEQCANEDIYFPPSSERAIQRRQVIVFVGSSYAKQPKIFAQLYGETALNKVLTDFKDCFEQPILEAEQRVDLIHRYIETHDQYDQFVLTRLWIYYCRTAIIHFLIEHSPLPLELYGYDWQEDPKTAPYYKGHVENGEELAELYRSVQYGLSVQPFMVGHQRLAEIKFCGATPLVFWTPNHYEHTDYQHEVLSFQSLEELQTLFPQFKQPPPSLPDQKIRQHFTYTQFALRCLETMHQYLLPENNSESPSSSQL